jgi:hypothetical protein
MLTMDDLKPSVALQVFADLQHVLHPFAVKSSVSRKVLALML